jgi:hypothetical protein
MTDNELLLGYYDRVRETIAGFDIIVVDVLTRGATIVLAVLVAPWSIFKGEPAPSTASVSGSVTGAATTAMTNWKALFLISLFALFAAAYIVVAVALYADLLSKAVAVGTKLERDSLTVVPKGCKLSVELEKNPLAGGRGGTFLYLIFASVLYLGTAATSAFYFSEWYNSTCIGWIAWAGMMIVLVILLSMLICIRVINLWERKQEGDASSNIVSKPAS